MAKRIMIQVTPEFNNWVEQNGRYGETKEAIIIRLLGERYSNSNHTGDRKTKTYDSKDVDSKKYKRKLTQKTGSEEKK